MVLSGPFVICGAWKGLLETGNIGVSDRDNSHPTAETIHKWLSSRMKGISLATVQHPPSIQDLGIVMELSAGTCRLATMATS